jgi:hypothetical protein
VVKNWISDQWQLTLDRRWQKTIKVWVSQCHLYSSVVISHVSALMVLTRNMTSFVFCHLSAFVFGQMTTDKWQLTNDNWQMTTDNWQLTTDNWQLTTTTWQLTADNWQLTTDNWQLTTVNWQLTTDNWHWAGGGWRHLYLGQNHSKSKSVWDGAPCHFSRRSHSRLSASL